MKKLTLVIMVALVSNLIFSQTLQTDGTISQVIDIDKDAMSIYESALITYASFFNNAKETVTSRIEGKLLAGRFVTSITGSPLASVAGGVEFYINYKLEIKDGRCKLTFTDIKSVGDVQVAGSRNNDITQYVFKKNGTVRPMYKSYKESIENTFSRMTELIIIEDTNNDW